MASVAVHLGPVMTCLRLHHQRILVDSSCPLRLSYRARIGQCQVIVLMPQIHLLLAQVRSLFWVVLTINVVVYVLP